MSKMLRLKHQLQLYLESRGMTASHLARRARVPKQSLSDWLSGVSPRKLEHLKRVADCLQVTIDHLCFGEGLTETPALPSKGRSSSSPQVIEGVFEVKLRRIR